MKRYSIAIFGSSLRPNFDKYSDKDLLIVSDSYSTLNTLKAKYEQDGYSVSTYTYKKLKYLSDKGSLFIQHLKIESQILTDYKGLLSKILENHKESMPSSEQIKESFEYFDFLKNIPNSKIGYAWFCDCFYVGLRNYLILKSAESKKYKFSFLNLLGDLLKSKDIDTNDFETLRQLRVLKKNYRERIDDELPSKDFINSLIKVGQKLNLLSTVNFQRIDSYNTNLLDYVKTKETNHYFKLRLIEIFYLLSGQRFDEIDRIICNPQLYAMKFKNSEFVNKIIADIEKKNGTQQPFCKSGGFVLL
jgi:predicted nucleotidyltransferase